MACSENRFHPYQAEAGFFRALSQVWYIEAVRAVEIEIRGVNPPLRAIQLRTFCG